MPLQQTSGNVTADAYGGGAAAVPNYIEDVFSTWLYTGNGSTQTITNGIDLAGKGGLVWCKMRSPYAGYDHVFADTSRGVNKFISSNSTAAQISTASISAFNANGFSMDGSGGYVNINTANEVSWTFRKQPKFFDVVTYTGDGTSNRSIAHSLNATPGCIIVKQLNGVADWYVYHRSADAGGFLNLNLTNAVSGAGLYRAFGATQTSTTFQTGSTAGYINDAGATYVAYIFAHNAGGFGLTGTDNVISCGSFTTDGSGNATVTLGYEPQWLLIKRSDSTGGWVLLDSMRGLVVQASGGDKFLFANNANAEIDSYIVAPTATGFTSVGETGGLAASATYIYIAIRRGPMKVPTDGTKVYTANTYGSGGNPPSFLSTFPVDMMLFKNKASAVDWRNSSRLLQGTQLSTNTTAAETTNALNTFDYMNGWQNDTGTNTNVYSWMFRRAPGFFDEVCYTGTGGTQTLNHNLGVAPELAIVKTRSTTSNWAVAQYSADVGLYLDSSIAAYGNASSSSIRVPTATTINVANTICNATAQTFAMYLFATCPGVSKVGSYTGNGSTQTINCGFTGGARFVLIKRTDSTGDWYVYDTARGMTTLTDPYLLLNSTAAEVATLGSVTTVTTGFAVNAAVLAAINTNGASYIFLAIA